MKAEARHSEIHGTGLFAIEEIEKDRPFLEYGKLSKRRTTLGPVLLIWRQLQTKGTFMFGHLKFVRDYT